MAELLGYIKHIGFFLLLMSVVLNVMPDNNYKKYCRLFCGLVLVVLVVTPFYEFLNYDGSISEIFMSNTYKLKISDLKSGLLEQENYYDDKIIERYEIILQEELARFVTKEGYYLKDVTAKVSEESGELVLKKLILKVSKDNADNDNQNIDNHSGNQTVRAIDIDKIDIHSENESGLISKEALFIIKNVSNYLHILESQIVVQEV